MDEGNAPWSGPATKLTNVRLPAALHRRIRVLAIDTGQSMSQIMIHALERYLASIDAQPLPDEESDDAG